MKPNHSKTLDLTCTGNRTRETLNLRMIAPNFFETYQFYINNEELQE